MPSDLFISYAWTSTEHREWVRLLAAHLKAIGFDVLIDADVDYGDDLNGFMRRAMDSHHVLLILDENYVQRADTLPKSGVGIETANMSEVFDLKPLSWLTVLFKDNPSYKFPAWFAAKNPKSHSFNSDPARDAFPGADQVTDLWRWIEGLPVNRDNEVTPTKMRERSRRLEAIDRQRDPSSWTNPSLEGDVSFDYEKSPEKTYSMGYGEFGFKLYVSSHGAKSVYVLNDPIHAVGINYANAVSHLELAAQLSPGRSVIAHVDEQVILMNSVGRLCVVDIVDVRQEAASPAYTPASVTFRYRVLKDS